jgi:hypothetical protein
MSCRAALEHKLRVYHELGGPMLAAPARTWRGWGKPNNLPRSIKNIDVAEVFLRMAEIR